MHKGKIFPIKQELLEQLRSGQQFPLFGTSNKSILNRVRGLNYMFKIIVTILLQIYFIQSYAQTSTTRPDYKQLFAEIFVKHVVNDPHKFDRNTKDPFYKVKDSIYFNPRPFDELYLELLKEKKSISVFRKREKLLSDPKILKDLMKGPLTPPKDIKWKDTNASEFISILEKELENKSHPNGNYFRTKVGQKVLETLKDTIFIIVPGFGNHIISHMVLPDLIKDINVYYGRSRFRPQNLIKLIPNFMDYKKYYGNNNQKAGFDILHPMGMELGLSIGRHQHNSQKLRDWINELPEEYKDKKIVFLGYSKGTTTALEVTKDFEDIRKRVRGIVGLAGPYQGSVNAEMILRRLFKMTPDGTKEAFLDWVKSIPSNEMVATLVFKFAQTYADEYPLIKTLLSSVTNLNQEHFDTLKAHIEFLIGLDLKEVINGFYEESQAHMLRWNIEHLNNETFNHPISFFSISFLTNVNDFFIKGPVSENGNKYPPEMIPQFLPSGGIDFESFSPDIFVQKITSIDTFEYTPAGTLDTQVTWPDSKPIVFDPTPLGTSFTDKELKKIYAHENFQSFFKKNNLSFKDFRDKPRNELISAKDFEKAEFIDLGEVRGTHWSSVFRQVLKLPAIPIEWGHNHAFPHRSMAKAFIEVYSIKTLLEKDGGDK